MCQHDALFSSCPFENLSVLCFPKPYVLSADNIEVRFSPQHTAQDVVVEIFIYEKMKRIAHG